MLYCLEGYKNLLLKTRVGVKIEHNSKKWDPGQSLNNIRYNAGNLPCVLIYPILFYPKSKYPMAISAINQSCRQIDFVLILQHAMPSSCNDHAQAVERIERKFFRNFLHRQNKAITQRFSDHSYSLK